jgi:copper chaperone CopZ
MFCLPQRLEHTMNPSMTKLHLSVDGMTCASCERHVRDALAVVPGVRSASVHLADGGATIEYDASAAAPADFVTAIDRAGYKARLTHVQSRPSSLRTICHCCASDQ